MPQRQLGNLWLDLRIKRYDTAEQAVKSAIQTIQFEVNRLKFLRLDDHICNLAKALRVQPEEAASQLLVRLQQIELNYGELEAVQLTFEHPQTHNFYQRNGINLDLCCHKASNTSTDGSALEQLAAISKVVAGFEKKLKSNEVTEADLSVYFQWWAEIIDDAVEKSVAPADRGHLLKYEEIVRDNLDTFATRCHHHGFNFTERLDTLYEQLQKVTETLAQYNAGLATGTFT